MKPAAKKSNQEIQRIYFIMYCIYKSTYIYIEQGQGHIHHGLHTVVVGGVQVQGHQETTEAVEGQGHQKGQDHHQEEGLPHVRGQGHQDKLYGGPPQEGPLQEGQGHHLMRGTSQ